MIIFTDPVDDPVENSVRQWCFETPDQMPGRSAQDLGTASIGLNFHYFFSWRLAARGSGTYLASRCTKIVEGRRAAKAADADLACIRK